MLMKFALVGDKHPQTCDASVGTDTCEGGDQKMIARNKESELKNATSELEYAKLQIELLNKVREK